jgi:surfeit locus 1 family protein
MRRYAALALGLAAALLFARLGVWQLARRTQRLAYNRAVEARLAQRPIPLDAGGALQSLPADSLRYRRVSATGRFDFPHQVVEIGRSFEGAPGVHLLTPLRLGDGTGLLVDRGWTYAADGITVDAGSVGEPDRATVEGILGLPGGRFAVRPDTLPVGYPLGPLVLTRTVAPPGLPPALRVARLPTLDAGPHLSYAIQWFSFAAIALVGGGLLARRDAKGPQDAVGRQRIGW